MICDEVVKAGRPHKLTYGPDPATHDHCTFGGMLGNNSCGVHAQMAGKAVENTEEMEILLYDGTRTHAGWMDDARMSAVIQQGGRVGEIHGRLRSLRDRYAAQIRARYPRIPRRVSGYNLDQLLPGEDGRFNLARALVGTESTCVTVLEAKVRLVYNHPERVLLVLGYPSVYQAADHLMEVLEHAPIGLEGLDERLKDHIVKKGSPHAAFLPLLPEGKGWLLVEFGYDTKDEATEQAKLLMARLSRGQAAPSMKLLIDHAEQDHLWKIRESGLGSTAFVPGEPDAWPGFEDSAVAPDKVGSYLRDLRRLFDRYGYNPSLYGHFGMGCIHCRIQFDLYTRSGVDQFKAFMDEATDLVVRYDGSFSGEHGDGQARAQFLPKMFGPELVDAFREFKAIWDPDGKMNPGKIVEPYHIDDNLRLGRGDYQPWDPETHFEYPDDQGSFAHATLRCVGIGKCRRKSSDEPGNDTMCPSYMVTHEEMHTTRGRAHLLWEMTQKEGPIEGGWRDEHIKEALDLCLSCKGCKGDCPVNVDVATYKAEFLSHYWEGRVRPRYAYAFGLIDKWARLASHVPGLANLATQLPGLRSVAKLLAGVPREREIPSFAAEPFTTWFKKRGIRNPAGRPVLLWPDTFNNYFVPETAQAAVEVLEALGHRVEIPQGHLCCGRPLYDYGMLDMAKRYLERVLSRLSPQLALGTPIVVLEPSCCAVFRDELRNLFPRREDARRLAEQTVLLSELLARGSKGEYSLPRLEARAVVHGHCHHKAIL
ncbi:MAG: FAD-binding and (Fe-S)-binding domain-containing protein, partial [Byssovorax sp.]